MAIAKYHLTEEHGVDFTNGSKFLSELFAASQVQTKFKDLWGWAKLKGWTDTEILSLGYAEAAWHDLFWRGENGNYASPTPAHGIDIEAGAGKYRVTASLPFAQGIYRGQGSRFHDGTGVHSYGSTEWYVDHANWKSARYPDRLIMRSTNWGSDDVNAGWCHHTVIEHMCFNMMRRTPWMVNDAIQCAGVGIWDAGETSYINHCYFINSEKDGMVFARGTPATATYCSFFNNSRFGVAVLGGGNVTLIRPSGDENGIALIGGRAAYNRPSAGQVTVIGAKNETGTSPQFRPFKGSAFIDWEGWGTITVHGCTYAGTWVTPYCFIRMKPDINTSTITISGLQFFNQTPKVLVYDEQNDKEYNFTGDAWNNALHEWGWHQSQGLKSQWATVPVTTKPVKGRLQHVGTDGAASWATAGIYDPTGGTVAPPTPIACTGWTTGAWSAWGTCVNGTQTRTRTVTATPAGCTGTPPNKPAESETQACTVTPPPTGGVIATVNNYVNTDPSKTQAVTWAGAKTFVFTGLKATAPIGYKLICGIVDTDGAGRGIMVLPNGSCIDNRVSQADRVIAPAGTVVAGVAKTFTVTLSIPMNVAYLGTKPGTGGAYIGTITKLEAKP